jgi:hypothetical protein
MIQEIANALAESWRSFATGFAHFVPRVIAAIIIFALGLLVAAAARVVVDRLLGWVHFDRLAQRTGAEEMLRVAELPGAARLVAQVVFWVVWIAFIVSAVDALQLRFLEGLVQGFFWFVPRLLVALVVLAMGFLIANFVWRATLLASINANLPGARLVSGALRLLVIAVAVVMALEQIGLATGVALTAFAIVFGAMMLGLAIAFGLGGRDAAARLLEQHFGSREDRTSDVEPHL